MQFLATAKIAGFELTTSLEMLTESFSQKSMREKEIRQVFEDGFLVMLERINPQRVVVYGSRRSNIFSNNPARTAVEFANTAGYNPASITTITGKGIVRTMRDGSVITHRFTSSKDGSPVVELKVHNVSGVKSQKIHFVKKGS